jgi:ATP synthase protein I
MEPLLASRLATHLKNSPNGDRYLCANKGSANEPKPSIETESNQIHSDDSFDEYVSFQRRIFRINLVVTAIAVIFTVIVFDLHAAISLLLGAFSGILYLRLLAKSIGSLGKTSSSVGKFQLLVPVVLILAVSKLSVIHLLPALLGFLLYKPSLIIQFLLEPSA